MTIADVKGLEVGSPVNFEATVVATIPEKGFFVNDGTEGIYVYEVIEGLQVGQKVRVQGKLDAYYNILQIGSEDLNVEVIDETIAMPSYNGEITIDEIVTRSYDKAEGNANGRYGGRYYNVYAKYELVKGTDGYEDFILSDPITGARLEVYYKSGFSYVTGVADSLANTLAPYVGKYIHIDIVTNDIYSVDGSHRVVLALGEITEASAPTLTDEDKVAQVVNSIENVKLEENYYNGDDFAYPTVDEVEGVTVEWSIDPASVLVDGKLVAAETTVVTLTAKVTCGAVEETVTKTFNVLAEEVILSVDDVKKAEKDADVTVKGLVAAVYGKGFVLYDTTGYILVYVKSLPNVNVGDYVKVNGAKGAYPADSTCHQIGSPNFEVLEEAVPADLVLPVAVEWDATKLNDAWNQVLEGKFNFAGPLVKMTLTLSVTSYYNATVEGSSVNVSISNPLDQFKESLVDGAVVTVTMMPISYSATKNDPTPKYFNFALVGVELPDLTDEEKLALDMKNFELPTSVTSSTTFPVTLKNGTTVTYTVEGTALAVDELGNVTVTRPAAGEADATVSVKAVFANGTAVSEGHSYVITVPAEVTVGTTVTETLDFVGSFTTYGGSWGSGYTVHTIDAKTDLGATDVDATITMSNSNKQTTTITDRPVLATKNTDQYITVNVNNGTIAGVTFNFLQWSEKQFTTLTIEYTTDGTTWVGTSVGIVNGTATFMESLSCDTLPANVTAVRFVCNANSDKNTQIGLTGITLTVIPA